jgi:ferredoxin-type protein NapH
VQALWAAATNSYAVGFLKGTIYRGRLKNVCVPGLNCYSCPGALGSCPIGALQAVFNSPRMLHASFYVLGLLAVFGATCGRFICGWLCPFGLIQELLHKIPFVRKIRTFHGDRQLRRLKYVLLAVLVVILPMFLVNPAGLGSPYFCEFVCPAGTLEGGIPLVAMNPALQSAVGWLYAWKIAILAAVVLASAVIYRPFCKYLCPLGAIYALFNPVSFYRLRMDEAACTRCGACARACPMQVSLPANPNGAECIRCGACKKACPAGAISMGFDIRAAARKKSGEAPEKEA